MEVKELDLPIKALRAEFGNRLEEDIPLARYTSSRIGGLADALVTVRSSEELMQTARWLWSSGIPFIVLGGGSNVLISDDGVREVVVLNRARRVQFEEQARPPFVWAESGANFGMVARQAGAKGLAGLAWAAGVPGTIGGAVVGNAGAHGGDMAGSMIMAEILHREEGRQQWDVDRLGFAYRTSMLKSQAGHAVVLSAALHLKESDREAVQDQMDQYLAYRRKTQPPGASMGSMFKNPPGDYAGRLVEEAGLKGARMGSAQISPLHANFFLNLGGARAADVYRLIKLARRSVAERFGIALDLEIELLGDWQEDDVES